MLLGCARDLQKPLLDEGIEQFYQKLFFQYFNLKVGVTGKSDRLFTKQIGQKYTCETLLHLQIFQLVMSAWLQSQVLLNMHRDMEFTSWMIKLVEIYCSNIIIVSPNKVGDTQDLGQSRRRHRRDFLQQASSSIFSHGLQMLGHLKAT